MFIACEYRRQVELFLRSYMSFEQWLIPFPRILLAYLGAWGKVPVWKGLLQPLLPVLGKEGCGIFLVLWCKPEFHTKRDPVKQVMSCPQYHLWMLHTLLRSKITALLSISTSFRTVASPRPEAPPVTIAILFFSFIYSDLIFSPV